MPLIFKKNPKHPSRIPREFWDCWAKEPFPSIHVWGLAASRGDDADWQRITPASTQQKAIYGSPGGTDNRTVSIDASFFGAAVVTLVTFAPVIWLKSFPLDMWSWSDV